jgi:peptide/nickel transport system substrate-binding protein
MRPASANRVSLCLAIVLIIGLMGLSGAAGCRRRTAEVAEYKDPHPLPAEPRVLNVASIGRYGGRFVVGQTSNPRTFNPMMANETSSSDITNLIFTSLVDMDNVTQETIPLLAKSWEVAPDRVTWTLHLRKGAAFSDGHPITAEDVLFSFEVVYDPTLHPSEQDLLKMHGKPYELSAPDPYTLVVKTPAQNAIFLATIGVVRIIPKHILEPAFKKGTFGSAYNVSTPPDKIVSSGAWRVTQYVPGEKTVVSRNPYWYGVDRQNHRLPYLDEVIFVTVPDLDAADLKFRSGELDGLDDVKPENYQWYRDHQKEGNYTLHDLGPDMNTNFLWFNLNRVQKTTPEKKLGEPFVGPVKYSWFRNPVFRRAVSRAIDRDAMIPSIFFGEGQKNWAMATASNKIWHNPDLVHDDYNPEESKKLLASLGWKDTNGDGVIEDTRGNPVSFTLKTNSSNTLRIGMANFIKDDLAKVGIRVTLAPVEFNTLITNVRSDFQYDAMLLGLQSSIPPDPTMMQNFWRSSGLTHNWFPSQVKPDTPEEARIDQLMDLIASTQDLATRKKAYGEVETIANEQGWLVWLPIRQQKLPVSNRFGNVQPSILAHRILWNIEGVYAK